MAKATIKSLSGAIITVEGSETEVSRILLTFDRDLAGIHKKQTVSKRHQAAKKDNRRLGASELVLDLKEERFFDKPKGLGDISKALEEKGHMYPVTTLSGIVLALVQKRLLSRKKIDGRWVYGK